MSDAPFAEVDDLAAWVGATIDGEDRAEALLMAASALVRAEVGATVTDAWETVPSEVEAVVVQVAARVWFNPQGAFAQTTGPFTVTWGSLSESGVYLTKAERDILSRFRTSGPRGLWTLGTTRADLYVDQYIDVVGQPNEPMPFLPPDVNP